jgi:hypothetical protein
MFGSVFQGLRIFGRNPPDFGWVDVGLLLGATVYGAVHFAALSAEFPNVVGESLVDRS